MISDNELFKYTNYIYFELSNMCNLSHYHKECPLSLEKNKIILPSKIVLETLDVLNKFNFNGTIAFHNYNEPLIDPRLIKFIEYSRKSCPNSKIYFSTNGIFLNQIILDELIEVVLQIYIFQHILIKNTKDLVNYIILFIILYLNKLLLKTI